MMVNFPAIMMYANQTQKRYNDWTCNEHGSLNRVPHRMDNNGSWNFRLVTDGGQHHFLNNERLVRASESEYKAIGKKN